MPPPLMDLSKFYLAFLVIMSLATFLVYFRDKVNARYGRSRTRERTLYLLSMVGGAFGGFLAMLLFKHKTRKLAFWAVQVTGMILHTMLFLMLF